MVQVVECHRLGLADVIVTEKIRLYQLNPNVLEVSTKSLPEIIDTISLTQKMRNILIRLVHSINPISINRAQDIRMDLNKKLPVMPLVLSNQNDAASEDIGPNKSLKKTWTP